MGLTDAERRGARVLALLLVLGTLTDVVRARRPGLLPAAPEPAAAVAGASDPPAGAPPPAAPAAAAPTDLNRATAAELDALPGIGPVLARRIVEHRARAGPFRSADELLAVPGIGARLLERLRPRLVVRSP